MTEIMRLKCKVMTLLVSSSKKAPAAKTSLNDLEAVSSLTSNGVRYALDFKVSVSRCDGDLVNWIDVLNVKNLPHPLLCDPIQRYDVKATIGRYIKFTSLKPHKNVMVCFAQTETQFVLRGISLNETKCYHIVAALDHDSGK
ncbi:hypothetical protein TCAL_16385 [Tigriopus californicus]|uniref:Uncharacterized protein n=1 Tax=Tigriopus californicus TaxID=6832 RepID=A0A553NZP9_TIGCA|nr:hypothetical protein TCAL_16385 [Tigriopus californicus]